MIKKLKLKIVLNNMILVGVVVALIFTSLCLLTFFSEEGKLSKSLEENIVIAKRSFPNLSDIPPLTDDKVYDISFTVFVNERGELVSQSNPDVGLDIALKAIRLALQNDDSRGILPILDLSYAKAPMLDGTIITFMSREHVDQRVKESIVQSIIAGSVSMLLFLIISKILADIAIAPVEKAWEQQKQFLADASHDLKTPLTVILANNNILSAHRSETVESQMKWIESTSEEAGRMSDLVNKMLELAKSEASKEELRFGEIDLSEVVENSILQFEVVAFEKNITIESGIQPDIHLRTHRSTLSKVLEILFDNAIKYSEENGTISVALYKSSKKVYFTINNKGEYIKPDELPHVFERFYRTNKEREVGGHGLGLSLAKKKCDMLGCKINAESNEEDGTTFTITFKSRK